MASSAKYNTKRKTPDLRNFDANGFFGLAEDSSNSSVGASEAASSSL